MFNALDESYSSRRKKQFGGLGDELPNTETHRGFGDGVSNDAAIL